MSIIVNHVYIKCNLRATAHAADPQQMQKEEKQLKKNARKDASSCSDGENARRRIRMSTHVHIAEQQSTALFAAEQLMSLATAASSFAFETASLRVLSPMLAPHVAQRSSRPRLVDEYKANTRSRMARRVQRNNGRRCKKIT